MASYQDFTVQATTGTALLGALPDDKHYYIVGASNAHTSPTEAKYLAGAGGKLFDIPKDSALSIPGMGLAVTGFRSNHSDCSIFYYIK